MTWHGSPQFGMRILIWCHQRPARSSLIDRIAVLKEYCSIIDTADLERYRGMPAASPQPGVADLRRRYGTTLPWRSDLSEASRQGGLLIATGFMSERKLFWWERITHIITRSRRREIQLTYPGRCLFRLPRGCPLPAARRCSVVGKTQPRMTGPCFLNDLLAHAR